jgi:hypothetical protein
MFGIESTSVTCWGAEFYQVIFTNNPGWHFTSYGFSLESKGGFQPSV